MNEPNQDWQARQLATARNLVQQGSQALRQNAVAPASELLTEASAVLDMAENPDDLEILKLRAQVANERGFLAQRRQDFETARTLHEEAVAHCDTLIERGEDFRGNATATNINLAGILANLGELEQAKQVNGRAVELVDALLDDEPSDNVRNLAFGAHQNMAVILARTGDLEAADAEMERATAQADEILAAGNTNLSAQSAQACQQVSVLMFHAEDYERAMRWGRKAESYSETAFEALGQPALPIYITSQINLISYYEKQGNFADAEDCLWKAVDVIGDHPDILRRGQAFYEECRKQADPRLGAGNLPREEVEAGFEELRQRIEKIGGLPPVQEQQQKQRPPQQ